VATKVNSPLNVRMTGYELNYRQALTFLPSWARGVQFFANITSQRAKDTDELVDMTPFSANWGLSLTRPEVESPYQRELSRAKAHERRHRFRHRGWIRTTTLRSASSSTSAASITCARRSGCSSRSAT
jgi:hypothetical protein